MCVVEAVINCVCAVNVRGSFLMIKHSLLEIKKRNYGRILLITSIAGKEVRPAPHTLPTTHYPLVRVCSVRSLCRCVLVRVMLGHVPTVQASPHTLPPHTLSLTHTTPHTHYPSHTLPPPTHTHYPLARVLLGCLPTVQAKLP